MNHPAQKIIVTGATSGIGRCLAIKLNQMGHAILAIGRTSHLLEELSVEHPKITTFRCDLCDEKQIEKLVSFVEEHHSDLNILINNAGIQFEQALDGSGHFYQRAKQEIICNYLAPLALSNYLYPILLANKNSQIININSGLAWLPKNISPSYCASKSALHSFSASIREQLKMQNIIIKEVFPPVVDTNMTKSRNVKKISAEKVADEIIRFISSPKQELCIGSMGFFRVLANFFPKAASMIINR